MFDLPRWEQYKLIDSGDFEKLEQFGEVFVVRPEPIAIWTKHEDKIWDDCHATYKRKGDDGEWDIKKPFPKNWNIAWKKQKFELRTTSFKHTGLFPEQASNWEWLGKNLKPGAAVLNLFGYTGGATIACAQAKASEVVHVDASRPAISWAKTNAELSSLGKAPIRWIEDDAQKFVARELRRSRVYDAIILDPPAFGRGPKTELWKFEEHLPALLTSLWEILNRKHGLLLLNAYSLGFPPIALEQLVQASIPWTANIETVELGLEETTKRKFVVPAGIAVRVTW
ncbi:class I SAM-dependent methyltransferase [Candidatus Parcubacteria bacterium]|nr:class I SAM-dependent methyltransferase [Candidatus Parcubacteria bacterium]